MIGISKGLSVNDLSILGDKNSPLKFPNIRCGA